MSETKYVVSYDISSTRRRNKIAKELLNYGKRVQYSVFECELSILRYKELYQKMLKLTEEMEDGNIRFYPLCKNCEGRIATIGIPEERVEDEEVVVI